MARLVYWYPNVHAKNAKLIVKQGGISDAVWNSKHLKQYRKGMAFGYVGSFGRTIKLDKYVEKKLRSLGMGPNAIGIWMTSSNGRHMMDNPHSKSWIDSYLKDAHIHVCVWQDKLHDGTLAATERLYPYYKIPQNYKAKLKKIG